MQAPVVGEGGIKALIVEDNPVALKMMATQVENCGFEVTAFSNAEEGWEFYRKESPRLIILDWKLPGMDGVALCEKLRQSEAGKHVVILMITSLSSQEEMESAIRAGVDSFMVKPVRLSVLAEWLKNTHRKLNDLFELEIRTDQVERYKEEMESLNDQLEASITRANQLALEAEQAYIELNQIFRTVAGGVVLIDRECNILRSNEAFLKMAGVPEGEDAPSKCYEAFHSCLCNTPDCPLTKIVDGVERVENEIEKQGAAGTVNYHIVSTPFKGPGGDLLGMVEYIMDISEMVKAKKALEESERKYRELSTVDELTGLFNKRFFNKTLQLEIDRAKRYGHPLTLIMMDIDNFKHHNDTYGHAEGDVVLAELGKIVTASVRSHDVACRYGGEEFAVILPETSAEDSLIVAERIRSTLASTDFFPKPEEKVNKTISIGIAQYVKDEKKISLVERADENLYEAKHQGKNRYVLR